MFIDKKYKEIKLIFLLLNKKIVKLIHTINKYKVYNSFHPFLLHSAEIQQLYDFQS